MPTIRLCTHICARRELCFDLSRSIDLHALSTARSNERAIAGRTSGLIGLDESVTWSARHFGIRQTLASRITEFERPALFVDEMVQGAFKSIRHEHRFEEAVPAGAPAPAPGATVHGTLMIDTFTYKSPLDFLGRVADVLFLRRYMEQLLTGRNAVIREYAESGRWKTLTGAEFSLY
jgi:ligand-binding SRPBCC domain-containing protein